MFIQLEETTIRQHHQKSNEVLNAAILTLNSDEYRHVALAKIEGAIQLIHAVAVRIIEHEYRFYMATTNMVGYLFVRDVDTAGEQFVNAAYAVAGGVATLEVVLRAFASLYDVSYLTPCAIEHQPTIIELPLETETRSGLAESFQQQLNTLSEKHNIAIASLRDEHEAAISTAHGQNGESSTRNNELEVELNVKNEEIGNLKSQLEAHDPSQHQEAKEALQKALAEKESEVEALSRGVEKQLKEFQALQQKAAEEREAEIVELKKAHQEQLKAAVSTASNIAINDLKVELATTVKELEESKEAHLVLKARFTAAHKEAQEAAAAFGSMSSTVTPSEENAADE